MKMIAESIECIDKKWESDLFRKNVFQLKFKQNCHLKKYTEDLKEIEDTLTRHGPCLLMSRIPCLETHARRALEATGFHLMECYIEMEHDLVNIDVQSGGNRIRSVRHEEIDALQGIALSALHFSRFHMDWNIDREMANLSRSEWIKNACLGRGEFVLVAEREGIPVGFVSCIKREREKETVGHLDLIAVDSKHRKLGIGYDLVISFLSKCQMMGIAKSIVGTQAHNIPSLRLYEKCHYFIVDSSYSYHKHIH